MTALQDSSSEVTESAVQTLLPVLAQWAFSLGWLQDRLLTRLLTLLHTTLKVCNVPIFLSN